MPGFEVWDIVKVPFPYTDRPIVQRRPALVVGKPRTPPGTSLIWVVMITSAENGTWASDVPIEAGAGTGLPAASLIRPAKIATLDAKAVEALGNVPAGPVRSMVRATLASALTAALAEYR